MTSSILLGIGIASMHYIGMTAASFTPSDMPLDLRHAVDVSSVGILGITAVTLMVLTLAVITSNVDRRFLTQARSLESSGGSVTGISNGVKERSFQGRVQVKTI